ncbi:MAG: flavodoxin-dependent (E)-4-hydroxy-3-methylbut-2-enyl-diphosphate synthase [Candidatus Omnitrophica bacterium]|nr:flavodoxin-dependent (E)-4-hydroxy-3-methylbut-2-enyl-diphosphate synthase [Candidatus Omnitrophota bacterium]
MRRTTRKIPVGNLYIGGDAPVSVQAMTKVPTANQLVLLNQCRRLVKSGAELIRISILTEEETRVIPFLKKKIPVPIIADIHYSEKLALAAMEAGADKIRVNPGNIPREKLRVFLREARQRAVPLRLGINSGSIQFQGSLIQAMVSTACDCLKFFEDQGVNLLIISLKTPSVPETVECYHRLAERCDYPFHLGITEAGKGPLAEAKSVLGIGSLLLEGIGDTLRVSLTESPEKEVALGQTILQAAGLRKFFPEIISCPGCGRTQVNLKKMVSRVRKEVQSVSRKLPGLKEMKIAVMGCAVNGPGEAKQADIGLAGGRNRFTLFAKGKIIGTFPEKKAFGELAKYILSLAGNKNSSAGS